MSRTISFPPSYRVADAGGAAHLGLDFIITSVRLIPGMPSPDNTYANSNAVFANAPGFRAQVVTIEQQIAVQGG